MNSPIAVLAAEGEKVEAGANGGAPRRRLGPRQSNRRHLRRSPAARPASVPAAPAAPAPRVPEVEPEWTGQTVNLTVREALRDAMAEEMRRDDSVFLMGEEVAEYQGAYKVEPGAARGVRRAPRDRHADLRARLHRPWHRRGLRGLAADRRVHDLELRHAGDGPDHQLRSKTRYMSGGQMGCPIVFRGPNGAASRVAAPTLPGLRELVRARARASR